ncbi:hypothetical protein COX95_03265 [bacterium CG_4_10_14_0_2_um_filter_33_32]|nr:MAG: hypothetical protein AUJ93_01775 [bacterium CG2_30_33_46]PIR67653.1 MAG: hypothetical protein COU50_02220 [bacterium CG10_big_fil_rev_8_21_14_0_10_33_18]PIU76939.1 MAG: hypothetical protein COS74_01430 [bacterium CG06_land_8_20_14_3_00_33_50]PIW80826.1 MAG: hypothetical protein COZ97_04485 [bacterium CG_4_8_14_3_um_filter_33_28]PIY85237.1 MAG: hypothetical protein COY76_03210 [bacterium CG_4_10_14_0_8_um_filter_33_57]PIZ85666.1 MAG: hypothetical protein COX95_03265 [bacterium CG_4_10_1
MNKNKNTQVAVIIISIAILIGCAYFLIQSLGIGKSKTQASEDQTETIPAPFDVSVFDNNPDDPRVQTLNKLKGYKDYVVPTPTDLVKPNPFKEEVSTETQQ